MNPQNIHYLHFKKGYLQTRVNVSQAYSVTSFTTREMAYSADKYLPPLVIPVTEDFSVALTRL